MTLSKPDSNTCVKDLAQLAFARRVEEASLNAWPAMHQVLLDGWLLRFSGGFTRRANSVTPLHPSTEPLPAKVRYCESLYARKRLRTVFRLPATADRASLDDILAALGYEAGDHTEVLLASLEYGAFAAEPGFALMSHAKFLAVYSVLTEMRGAAVGLHDIVLKAIQPETAFGVVSEHGEPVACGMVVVERELAGLFDIVTHPMHRRRGHGGTLVCGLLARAKALGARYAYLQVRNDNAPARRLYEGLGFASFYDYWYRTSKDAVAA